MNQRSTPATWSRRDLLKSASCGFGYLAMAGMAASEVKAAGSFLNPLMVREPHHAQKAKRVIFLFMAGGPSQHETFDHNPELVQAASKEASGGGRRGGALLPSAFQFSPSGASGIQISEVFPQLQKQADSLCILNGMHTDTSAHPQAQIMLHTGSFTFVRPSIGAWTLFGLGTENQNLPGFITINPAGIGGTQNFGSAFLPATYQGTPVQTGEGPVPNISNPVLVEAEQRRQLEFVQSLNRDYLRRAKVDGEVEGVIQSYELAFRMQAAVPDLMDLTREPESMREMYGLNRPETRTFGMQCLLARRLAEAGVRFIELGNDGWDHHNNLKNRMAVNARAIDQPMAALIADLRGRGMLDDTLILWGGEFGRTPIGQNADGRQHNSRGYTMWMAGGGVKGGIRHGASDASTGAAVSGKVHLHDLHATVLHLLGLNHERLTYRYAGRDFRLTDVYGRVVQEILA